MTSSHDAGPNLAQRIVVMGVSGCGKSTLGQALADALGLPYIEGDELHPPRNVERMAAGIALTDADRQGWLETIAQRLRSAYERGQGLVVSCSALKRRYRDLLRAGAPDLRFVHLHGAPELLAARLRSRTGHYMPASLLQSQLEALEPPGADEAALTIDCAAPPDAALAQVLQQLAVPR
jgi:gluconokinase